jgi:hypothetical protein
MNSVNEILGRVGLQIGRKRRLPREFVEQYRAALNKFRKDSRGFEIIEEVYYDVGNHPQNYVDYECEFAAGHLSRLRPDCVLDIGSHERAALCSLAEVTSTPGVWDVYLGCWRKSEGSAERTLHEGFQS